MSESWGVPIDADMTFSWPSMPPKPNNSQETPISWGSDRPSDRPSARPSAPSESNMSPKKPAQDSWGQGRSENSYISRNDVAQVDRFSEKPFSGKESTKLPDNVPPVNTRSPPINDQRDGDDDQQLADIALQAVLQNSFESEKERKEQREQQQSSEEDYWDPNYRNNKNLNLESNISQSDVPKGRAEPSITSPNSTLSKKGFRDVEVQTDEIDLTKIIASKEKLLSCTIDSPIMKDYQQNVPEKRHSSQQPSLLDLGPDEWENTYNKRGAESSWNKSSDKSDFRDNVISPTRPEFNAREPDNDSRKPIQPPNNENPSRNNNLDFGPQPTSVQANSRGPPPSDNPDWGTVSQQTPTQDNFYSQQPVRDNQSNKNDRSQDVSNGNQGGQQSDSWEGGPQNGESDWLKKADMFNKELGLSNATHWGQSKETKDQRTEESHGTFNDNSSSNNRYGNRDVSRDGNRYGNRGGSRDGSRYGNRDSSRDDNRYGNRDSSRDSNRFGNRNVSRDGNRGNRDSSRDSNRYGNRNVSRDGNRDGNRYDNKTDESSRDGYGGGRSCYKCGEEGHMAKECPKESSRGGYDNGKTCFKCNKGGHLAKECPDEVCYKCNKRGHRSNDCNEDACETTGQDGNIGEGSRDYNRPKLSPFSNPGPSDISPEDAWAKLLKADKEKDIDDFKEAFESYAKGTPKETFQSIERKLRDSGCNSRIIALKREEIPLSSVLVDLQGNINKKYVATPVMGPPSSLRRSAGSLAPSEQENFEWLADSGFMVDDNIPICYNCKQKGHHTKECREPKREPEKQQHIGCQNCHSLEHMTRNCTEERRDYYAEARDRKAAGSYNRDRDPINDDKASFIYDGEESKGFRGYASNNSQTCHNCHREGHISRDCPEKRSGGGGGGGRKCYNCGEEGHMSKDCKNSNRGNYNDYNKTASLDTDYNNSQSKTSRDDQNYDNYSQNREVRNDIARDSSVSTQDRTVQQKDITPYNTEKRNVVEPDTWESNTNASKKIDWGNKTHTFADFNWETSNGKKESVSDKPNKDPEDYENKRGDYNKGSDDYENRRGRGNDYSYNKGSDDYDNRRGRGNSNSYNNNTDDYGRGRGNESYNNNRTDDYGRGRNNNSYNNRSDDYDNRRGRDNNNSYSSYNNKGSDDYGRSRGNDYNNSRSDDWRSRNNNSYNNNRSDDYDNRRGRNNNNSYNNSDDYDNKRGRDNSSYNNKGPDDYGRGRGNDSYNNNRSDDWRSRNNNSYNNNRSDDYDNRRGRNNNSDDYDNRRGRDNSSYNNKGPDDYGRSRGGSSYNNDYGRSRGNDSYNKGSGDYGRNRGNDHSYNRGSDDYDRRDRRESREQSTQSNSNAPAPNLDNVQTWW